MEHSIGDGQMISALVVCDGRAWGPWTVETLDVDGVSLRGKSTMDLAPGAAWVILTFPERQMIRIRGRVERVECEPGERTRCSVSFQPCSQNMQKQIRRAVVEQQETIERLRMPVIVALDCDRLSRTHIRRDLRLLGREIVLFGSPLDAVWFMNGSRDAFSTILVDASFVSAFGSDVLQFLLDHYPDKRRLLACRREPFLPEVQSLLWSIHGILDVPWTQAELEMSLGIVGAGSSHPKRRILFVDDEPAILLGLQLRLRKHLTGCEAVWVTSGEVALAEFKSQPFDVVVSDLKMPGMDGLTLLKAVKQCDPKTRRIVLSGCDLSAAADVADCLLPKPCPIDELRRSVLNAGA